MTKILEKQNLMGQPPQALLSEIRQTCCQYKKKGGEGKKMWPLSRSTCVLTGKLQVNIRTSKLLYLCRAGADF